MDAPLMQLRTQIAVFGFLVEKGYGNPFFNILPRRTLRAGRKAAGHSRGLPCGSTKERMEGRAASAFPSEELVAPQEASRNALRPPLSSPFSAARAPPATTGALADHFL
jgi:hypothetical protein